MFAPLMRTRGLLLVDQRGTGGSALIDCRACSRSRGARRGRRSRGGRGAARGEIDARYGRGASALFATAYASDDLAAVLRALRLRKVDLYGDSYGTFFVQDFIARHPALLHSLMLDSTYPAAGSGPLVRVVGRGDAGGAGDGLAGVGGAAGRVARAGAYAADRRGRRATPTRARCRRARRPARACRPGPGRGVRSGRPCASSTPRSRAALAGDDVPLLRLAGQSDTWNHSPSRRGLLLTRAYLAVSCPDYPVVRTCAAAPPDGASRRSRAPSGGRSAASPSRTTSASTGPRRAAPAAGTARDAAASSVLIVGGDLDSLTPLRTRPRSAPRSARTSSS